MAKEKEGKQNNNSMIKQNQNEEREIKGEVEGHGSKITPFPGNRGTRGIKIENEWRNVINDRDYLENMEKEFPRGSYVRMIERKNKKGYWDVAEGSLRSITKQEAYNKDIRQVKEPEQKPAPVEEIENTQRKEVPRKIMTEEKQTEKEFEEQRKHAIENGQKYLTLTRDDILKMSGQFLNDSTLKSIELPISSNGINQINAILVIDLSAKEGPKTTMQIRPTTKPEFLHALVLMLAHIEISKDMVMEKIKKLKIDKEIEIDKEEQ